MLIALFGATGFTGKTVLREALAKGHHVRALLRPSSRLDVEHANLEILRGDALSSEDIGRLIQGVDAIVHCLGVGGKGSGGPTTLVSDSIRATLDAMHAHGVERLVCMSNVGAGGTGPWYLNSIVVPLFLRWLRPLIDDKDRMEALLEKSSVDWVSVRLPNIIEGPAKDVRVSEDGKRLSLSITDTSVAHYMLEQAQATHLSLRTPCVSN